jgi:hypothetical protein
VSRPVPARQFEFGEVIDLALKLYGRHWRALTIAVVAVVAPIEVISVFATLAIAPEMFDLTAAQDGLGPVLDVEGSSGTAFALLGLRLLELFAFTVAVAAAVHGVMEAYEGGTPAAGRLLAAACARAGALISLSVVTLFVVALGLVLLIVPGVWVGTLWALALPALVLERVGVVDSLRRSAELVGGRFWPMLGLLALTVAGLLVTSLVLGGVLGGIIAAAAGDSELAGALVTLVAGVVGAAVTGPVLAAVITVAYIDRTGRPAAAEGPEPAGDEPAAPPTIGGWQPPVPPVRGPRI